MECLFCCCAFLLLLFFLKKIWYTWNKSNTFVYQTDYLVAGINHMLIFGIKLVLIYILMFKIVFKPFVRLKSESATWTIWKIHWQYAIIHLNKENYIKWWTKRHASTTYGYMWQYLPGLTDLFASMANFQTETLIIYYKSLV